MGPKPFGRTVSSNSAPAIDGQPVDLSRYSQPEKEIRMLLRVLAVGSSARKSSFRAASLLGNTPRTLMILHNDRFSDSRVLVV